MNVYFGQIYGDPNATFPLSHLFQRRISEEVTVLVEPSTKFLREYGDDFKLIFRMSAKLAIQDNEIKGPTVFKKTKDVEYSVFLPFDIIMRHKDAPRYAIRFLLKGVCDVFDKLEIDKTKLLDKQDSIIEGICSDSAMLAAPSWNEADNKTQVRTVFADFFQKNRA